MREIDDGVSIAVFDTRRDLRRGVRVNGCTKVASVSLRHLNVNNLRYVKWTASKSNCVGLVEDCPFHELSMGHSAVMKGRRFSCYPVSPTHRVRMN